MVEEDGYDVIVLYRLVKKICNWSSYVVVNDVLNNVLEAMHNFMLVKGDEYLSLPKYLEAAKQRFDVLKESDFDMASEGLRDVYMAEMKSRGNIASDLY